VKPIIYIDVDDTLIRYPRQETRAWWNANPHGVAAPGAGDFLTWAVAHCDPRWLTSWCPSGTMDPSIGVPRLAKLLGIPESTIARIYNPMHWIHSKVEGIDWEMHYAGREWAWIEDELPAREIEALRQRRAQRHYSLCNTSLRPDALITAWRTIAHRFRLHQTLPQLPITEVAQ
jgi:hypothetical protein